MTLRKSLIAMRVKHTGNKPITHRLSNLIEQVEQAEARPDDARLRRQMARTLREINQIKVDGLQYVPANHRNSASVGTRAVQ